MPIARAVSLFALLTLAAASLGAQVVARQGDPAESPLQEFKSPMVLELPLKDFRELPKGTGRDFKEVRRYYCEDVVLSQLVVSPKKETAAASLPSCGWTSVERSPSGRPLTGWRPSGST